MAFLPSSRYSFSLLFLVFYFVTLSAKPFSSFSFKRFDENPEFDSKIALYGDAKVVNAGSSVKINSPSISSAGKLIYRNPIKFHEGNPRKQISFSTYFSFSISPENGDGLAFMLLPSGFPLEVFDGRSFGLSPGFKKRGVGFLVVEFDTSMNVELGDLNGNHVGIDIGSLVSARVSNVSSINLVLNSGQRLHSWIDYDASSKRLEVRLGKLSDIRPKDPLLSYQIDLSEMWKGKEVFVGIGSSSGNSTQTCSVYSWSFRLRHVPTWMHSEPLDPRVYSQETKHPTAQGRSVCVLRILTVLLFGTGCGALAASVVLFLWAIFVNRRAVVVPAEYPVHPVEFGYEKIKVVTEKANNDGKK
ncbi:Legume lectin domain [Macleaya cordata]|uniref:Legume lectin domain n=1 Tax=Macleaya cordata TaxID=56857 RepID=A0A200R4T0_MACCD|nr:Legume lectin domain [Macleaya cordata]